MAAGMTIVWAVDYQDQVWDLVEPPLDRAADIVLNGMERRIPRSTEGSHGRPPGYAASRLRVLARGRDALGPVRDVGTDATSPDGFNYSRAHEHGTKPHWIESHGPWPLRRGRRVFGRRVFHPGTRPYPWARPSANDIDGRTL